jgi:hypothetical protein
MAVNPQQELIWQGRTHLGDEPGVFGDSHYSGIAAELPITVRRLDPDDTEDVPFKLVLDTENLETFGGYPGHAITVIIYEPDPTQPFHSVERILARDVFTSADNNHKEVTVSVGKSSGPFFISVRLRIDTTVNPGFYDDFVWIRLSLLSEGPKFFASFGFDNP